MSRPRLAFGGLVVFYLMGIFARDGGLGLRTPRRWHRGRFRRPL